MQNELQQYEKTAVENATKHAATQSKIEECEAKLRFQTAKLQEATQNYYAMMWVRADFAALNSQFETSGHKLINELSTEFGELCQEISSEIKKNAAQQQQPPLQRWVDGRENYYDAIKNAIKTKVGNTYLNNFPPLTALPQQVAGVIHEILNLQKFLPVDVHFDIQNAHGAELKKFALQVRNGFGSETTLGKVAGWFERDSYGDSYINSVTWPTRSVAAMIPPSKKRRVLGY